MNLADLATSARLGKPGKFRQVVKLRCGIDVMRSGLMRPRKKTRPFTAGL
jgi:hypothetical protein